MQGCPNAIALDHVEPPYRNALQLEATRRGLSVVNTPDRLDAPAEAGRFALAVHQIDRVDDRGVERVRAARRMLERTPSVVLGRVFDPESVFELSRIGIAEVLHLPKRLGDVVTRCFAHVDDTTETPVPTMIGRSAPIEALRRSIQEISRTRCNVLITGETGTGKGLVARAIHSLATRGDDRLIQVDCAALSPTLIESELFGHEKGSFTGAVASRIGRFETAGDGVIFLDEIGELDVQLQSKFLRVLEDREFERVGGTRTLSMKARVIAATSRDLEAELAKGSFRADLYYRLRVVHLHVPPLRERLADVPLLVASGAAQLAARLGVPEPVVASEAIDRLTLHPWPGNVRELMNTLEALLVRHPGRDIEAHHVEEVLPAVANVVQPAGNTLEEPLPAPRDEAEERAQLLELLVSTGGNVARVARRMNMARSTVRYKIRRHRLTQYIPKD